MREDITIYGKRLDHRPNQWGHIPHILRSSDAGDSDQWITSQNNKGKACPGGDAYWKGFQKISCVYNVKTGDKLGRLRTLHSEIKNAGSGDPRKAMFDKIATRYCDRADRLNDRITSGSGDDSTCRGFSNAKALAKDYCKNGDKIKTDTMLCTKENDSLGPTLYDQLASKYCDANPDDPFCGCYNVVKNKCRGEEIDKEIKRLEDGRKPIEGVRYVWFGFDNRKDYLNITQIEVFSGKDSKGVPINILRKTLADGSEVPNPAVTITASSTHSSGQYGPDKLNDGNYVSIYHSETGHQSDHILVDLGKSTTIDSIKVWNRQPCDNHGCEKRWRGAFIKLKNSDGVEIKRSERIVGDHMEDGKRVKTFFDNGVAAAKEKLNLPGCKITVPIRRTLTDLPRKYSAALDGTDKCWGNVCTSKGGETFVPEGTIDSLCSKSMTICNVDLSTGDLENSDVTIEQKCGEQEGTPAPMSPPSSGEPSEPSDGSTEGTPAPMDSSGKSSSVPLTSTSTPTAVDGVASTEELKIYEKPSVQIGTVASSLVSISSCAMLIMLAM